MFFNNLYTGASFFFTDFDLKYFWNWTDFTSYIEFISTFTLIVGLLMYFLINNTIFVDVIGYISLTTEAILASPQIIKNFQNKSTVGLSKKMVFLWTAGDIFKTCYFIAKHTPSQFLICGACQISIDLFIAFQIFLYRNNFKKFSKG